MQTSMVKMAAPALSPVVIGLNVTTVLVDVSPAFGSDCEVAPVFWDRGAIWGVIRVVPMTDRAAIYNR